MLAEVTAVITTYNRVDLLSHAVDSVLQQTYENCRALIIDDGSTDSTRSLIADRYGGNPRIEYVYQTNRGVSRARNRGIALARGDYIAFLDSDDVWKKWKIALQVACLQKLGGVGMIWTDMDAVDATGTLVKPKYMREHYGAYSYFPDFSLFENLAPLEALLPAVSDPCKGAVVYWGDVFSAMLMGNLCLPSTLLVTREAAQKAGPVDESLKNGEDYDYHWRLSREAKAAFVDVASTIYRTGAQDQMTHPAELLTIAQNTLKTIRRTLERDRARVMLPEAMVRRKLAAVHEWIATEHLNHRDHRAARANFARSVMQRPLQTRAWLLLAASCAHPALSGPVRAAYRRMKRSLSHV